MIPGGRAGREDVDVAARLRAAPQAADDVEGRRRRGLAQPVHERFGDARRVAHQVPPDVLLALGDGGDDELFLLGAHALQLAERTGLRGALELVDRRNLQLLVDQGDRLRADALQAHHLEDGRRELLEQFLMIRRRTGGRDLADASGRSLPMPGRARSVASGRSTSARTVGDDLRTRAIRADTKRILALELEQVGDFVEDSGDAEVLHGP